MMRPLPIRAVRLPVGTDPETAGVIQEEFPTVKVDIRGALVRGDAVIDLDAWAKSASFDAADLAVDGGITERIYLEGDAQQALRAVEVLTRYQRFVYRRTPSSLDGTFATVLKKHRALHRLEKPLVRADFDHALDTWQWLHRLVPDPSVPLQLAALFHDIERLESEADVRIEHRAPKYAAFKAAHARRGGEIAYDVLTTAGVDPAVATRVRELIACHERRDEDREVGHLNDADGLSFFSVNSASYLDHFGSLQTRRKIGYTLARLGRNARFRLATIRLRPDVEALFREVLRA